MNLILRAVTTLVVWSEIVASKSLASIGLSNPHGSLESVSYPSGSGDHDVQGDPLDVVVVFKGQLGGHQRISKRSEHIRLIEAMSTEVAGTGIKGYFNAGRSTSGYHGRFTQRMIEYIKTSPEIAIVESDSLDMVQGEFIYEQLDADWGLSRISHLLDTYGTATQSQYLFQPEAGQNSTIYILDTGVRITHRELVGRAQWGANFANDIDEDENGHGTHVAGIAAGSDVGVAKYANIVAVKVLNKNQTGTLSNFIKGLSWIIDDVKSRPNTRAIINYSAVGEVSDARAQALQEVVDAGILFVGASGNSDTDACSFGPPNDVRVGHITAAALNFTDEPAAFTNYGPCVQVFAPGVDIRSSINTSDEAYGIMSGSSMAAPHVAGLAAYFWSINGSLSLSDITSMITEGNQGRIINAFPDTVNKIAYNRVS